MGVQGFESLAVQTERGALEANSVGSLALKRTVVKYFPTSQNSIGVRRPSEVDSACLDKYRNKQSADCLIVRRRSS